MPPAPSSRPTIGWREWVALPDLGIQRVKAKVDTGARTSSLHAWDVEEFRRGRTRMVRFKLHPEQKSARVTIRAEAPLHEHRSVKPSSGESELRPVILATLEIHGQRFEAELTLTRRDEMGFRMLLGRQALRGRFLVDPGRSFVAGRRKKSRSRRGAPGNRSGATDKRRAAQENKKESRP